MVSSTPRGETYGSPPCSVWHMVDAQWYKRIKSYKYLRKDLLSTVKSSREEQIIFPFDLVKRGLWKVWGKPGSSNVTWLL